MKTYLIILLFPFLMQQQNNYQIDFGEEKKGRYWSVVNDGVMGGLSRGSKKLTKNSLLFKGNVSLDNNGGFSSLRRSFSEFDISNFEYVEIKYRSSGISLALTFAVSRRWYVPNYKVSLDRTSSKWKTITLKLTDLRKYYIGKAMNEKLKKETLKEIIRIGFITDEKKYGDFEFEIDYIKFK
jgi:NADH dehydrogenase [ubiquinone] 1 alpha subcomplex assembly factor 1